jgi:hypothetical protein
LIYFVSLFSIAGKNKNKKGIQLFSFYLLVFSWLQTDVDRFIGALLLFVVLVGVRRESHSISPTIQEGG